MNLIRKNSKLEISKLIELFGWEVLGEIKLDFIYNVSPIEEASENDITFLHNPKYYKYIETTNAYYIIVPISEKEKFLNYTNKCFLLSKNPYLDFQKLITLFFEMAPPNFEGKYTVIKSEIGKDIVVGDFVYIGENVSIGKNTIIYPFVYIGDNVKIGENVIIYPNVTIRESVEIGNNVIIHSGSVIGSDGFGFSFDGEKYIKIPQVGNVIIEDDVEIGANTTIDRAALKSTIIKKGSKIDNLVQIAHNVIIGENTAIAAQSGISGSTKIGKYNIIGGQAGFVGHISTGDFVKVGAKAGVSKSIPSGEEWTGYPARKFIEVRKAESLLYNLEKYVKKIRELEKEIEELKNKIK